jgi:formate-dependent phosphoribosylglycinamide formyltransferase (GAR transformylase)
MPDDHPTGDPHDRPAPVPNDVASELAELGLTEAELDTALEHHQPDIDLADVWEPDEHMIERVTANVATRIANREALQAIVDLGGLGWFTLKVLFSDQNRAP